MSITIKPIAGKKLANGNLIIAVKITDLNSLSTAQSKTLFDRHGLGLGFDVTYRYVNNMLCAIYIIDKAKI